MEGIFFTILSMSAAAGVTAAGVMLLRPFLKGAPRWISCALWAVVLFRMVCPVSFSSPLSLVPQTISPPAVSAQPLPAAGTASSQSAAQTAQGTSAAGDPSGAVPPSPPEKTDEAQRSWQAAVPWVWLAGAAVMLFYALISYRFLKRKLADGVKVEEGVYETDAVNSPFVCGFFSPRIYLPVGLPAEERRYVLLHERAHLRRRDHQMKPLAFLALAAHWFNPVLWISFALYSRDVESACDQAVIASFTREETAGYSAALLHLGRPNRIPAAGPLAFGEENAKGRIQGILRYRKPALGVSLAAIAACIMAAAVLLGNPASSLRPTQGEAAPAQLASAAAQRGDAENLSAADLIPGAASPALQGQQTMQLRLTGRVEAMALYAQQWQEGMLLAQDCLAYTNVSGSREASLTLSQALTDKGLVWWQLTGLNQDSAPLSGIVTLPYGQGGTFSQWVGVPRRQTLRAGGSYILSAAMFDPGGGSWSPETLAQNPDAIRTAPAAFVLRLELFAQPAGETPPTSAHDTPLADTLYALKNPYLGDASADGAILQALHIGDRVGPYTMALQTQQPPYGITLSFSDPPAREDDPVFSAQTDYLWGCANLFLALVNNADTVSWNFPAAQSGASGTVTNQTEAPGAIHPKDYGTSLEQFRQLVRMQIPDLSRVMGERLTRYCYVPGRILYLSNPPEAISQEFLLSLYGNSVFALYPDGFSVRWGSLLSSALPETITLSRPDYRPADLGSLDFPGSQELHLTDYAKKTAYQVYTSDGQDTGYRLFLMDDDLYAAYWKKGTLAYFIQLTPSSPSAP